MITLQTSPGHASAREHDTAWDDVPAQPTMVHRYLSIAGKPQCFISLTPKLSNFNVLPLKDVYHYRDPQLLVKITH